jgi:hypothetical protein
VAKHHTKQFERRGADDFAAVPKLSFDELGIAAFTIEP